MIIARIESLVLNKGLNDAITRARKYIAAGAGDIMIQQKKNPSEILKFCKIYKKFKNKKPLVVVPSSYSQITEDKLEKEGANIVIYANHLLEVFILIWWKRLKVF